MSQATSDVQRSTSTQRGPPLCLETLELDPTPTFIIRTGTTTLEFDIIFANEAFRNANLKEQILAQDKEALLFRSWTQALGEPQPWKDHAGIRWFAEAAGKRATFKIIHATTFELNKPAQHLAKQLDQASSERARSFAAGETSPLQLEDSISPVRSAIPPPPSRTSLDAQWDVMQTMMEMSDVGVFEYNAEGKLLHANEAWYRLSSHPRNLPAHVDFSFMDLVFPDDQALVISMWNKLTQGKPVTFEMRWKHPTAEEGSTWILSACVPIFEGDKVTSIAGNTIDINAQKKIQTVQRRRIEEALEAKRQQENFIDMTSHELRNPLSAVIQCTDSIIATLHYMLEHPIDYFSTGTEIAKLQEEIESSLDSLQTIVSCSLHQKRVIDDVLTLSKLDSNLILITPVKVQPTVVVTDAMRIFDAECSQMDVKLEFEEDPSLRSFAWVMLDPSRLTQILINLLTNAIKFTKDRPERVIKVKLGGSMSRPPNIEASLAFPPDDQPELNVIERTDWGTGDRASLWVTVTDTGCGMTKEDQEKLFFRFSQATPKTHIKYGGSGLGLFISRSLATLQGGAIGVCSQADVGSTFAFYVSTRLADAPQQQPSSRRPLPIRTLSADEQMKSVKLNVLIVEDNLVNQKVLKKQLQKYGWNISVAGHGEDALRWLTKSIFWRQKSSETTVSSTERSSSQDSMASLEEPRQLDLILMDIEMPIMDGLTCAKKIREYEKQGLLGPPETSPASSDGHESPASTVGSPSVEGKGTGSSASRLPILAVSANARLEQIKQAIDSGMDDAISKPFRIPELWPKIRGLVPRASIG